MRDKLILFMRGRNGNDELNLCLLVLAIIISIASYFYNYLSVLSLIIMAIIFYRMFSRNIYKRRKENALVSPYFAFARAKANDKGQHKLFMCPKCKKTLRVPRGKGKITLRCPCGNSIRGKS